MKLGAVYKQPNEIEMYSINYEDDLSEGDNVVSATVSVSPSGELVIDQITPADPRIRFRATGGEDGTNYIATFTTVTADGRTLEDEVTIKVKER